MRAAHDSLEGSSEDDEPPLTYGGHGSTRMADLDEEDDELPPLAPNGGHGVPLGHHEDDLRDGSSEDSLPPLYAEQGQRGEVKGSSEDEDEDDFLPPLHNNNSSTGAGNPRAGDQGRLPNGFHSHEREEVEALGDSDDDLPPVTSHSAHEAKHLDAQDEPPPLHAGGASGGHDAKAAPPMPARQPVGAEALNNLLSNLAKKMTEVAPESELGPEVPPPAAAGADAAAMAEDASDETEDPPELHSAKQRIQTCRRVDDRQKVAAALCECAEVCVHLDRIEEALQHATEARSICKSLFNGRGEAEALRVAVKAHTKSRRYNDAMRVAEEELEAFRDVKDKKAEVVMLLAVSDVHFAQDNYSMAAASAEAAAQISVQAEDVRGEASAREACIRIYAASERWQKVQWSSAEAIETLESAGDIAGRASVLMHTALAHCKGVPQDVETGWKLGKESQNLYKELGDKRGEAKALRAIAYSIKLMQDGEAESLRALNKALAISKDAHDKEGELIACMALATTWLEGDKQEDAMRATRVGSKIARELNDGARLSEILDTGIQIHFQNELPEKALALVDDEVRFARKAKNTEREAYVIAKVAQVKLMEGKHTEALKAFDEAIACFQQVGGKKGQAAAQLAVSEALFSSGQHQQALNAAKDAEALYRGLHDTRNVVKSLQFQVRQWQEMGRQDVALQESLAQVKVFGEAGYKEDEAATQHEYATLLCEYKGEREALKAMKEALQMYKDLKDKNGEAVCMMTMAVMQANNQAPTDALRSANEAAELSKEMGNVENHANALQLACEIYLAQNSIAEALKMSNTAVEVCKKADDHRQMAEQMKKTAEVYLRVMAGHEETGRPVNPRHVKDGLKAAEGSREMFGIIQDPYGEADAYRVISRLHLFGQEGEKAAEPAHTALQICSQLNDPEGVGHSYICLVKAHLALGNQEDALGYAHEAQTCFKQVGNNEALETCRQLIAEAQEKPKRKAPSRSQSTGRNLGRNGRGSTPFDELEASMEDAPTSGAGSGNRSKSASRADARQRQSDSGRAADSGTTDSVPLPKSLNLLKGPEPRDCSKVRTKAIMSKIVDSEPVSADANMSFGFGRGAFQSLGWGRRDFHEESDLLDDDEDFEGEFAFRPHSLDLEQRRAEYEQKRDMQRGLGAQRNGQRPLQEVDGLD